MVRHADRFRVHAGGRMLRDNEVLKKMIATGEERMSKMASQLLQNETFMGALQKTMSAALDVKATAERAAQSALSAMNIPTSGDVRKLEGEDRRAGAGVRGAVGEDWRAA